MKQLVVDRGPRMGSVAERIRAVRKERKLSQAEFAQKLKITRGHISKLEIGQAIPSEQLLALICEIFAVKWDWLVRGEGDMHLARTDALEVQLNAQKMGYDFLKGEMDIFLLYHEWTASRLVKGLKSSASFAPDLCPPDLIDLLRRIAKMPEDELFQLARARLLEWDLYSREPKEE